MGYEYSSTFIQVGQIEMCYVLIFLSFNCLIYALEGIQYIGEPKTVILNKVTR